MIVLYAQVQVKSRVKFWTVGLRCLGAGLKVTSPDVERAFDALGAFQQALDREELDARVFGAAERGIRAGMGGPAASGDG